MPVHRYRRVEDMPPPPPLPALHPENLRVAFGWCLMVRNLARARVAPGLHRRDLRFAMSSNSGNAKRDDQDETVARERRP